MAIMSYDDLRRYAFEAVSQNGSEGLGGSAEGFETANQGVTRRRPGEAPKADGGRSQSQEMDSYDQPQYVGEAWNGYKDPGGFENQEHRGLTNPDRDITDDGIEGLKEMFGESSEERIMWSPGEYGADTRKVLQYLDKETGPGQSLFIKLGQAGPYAQVEIDEEEAAELLGALTQFLRTRKYDTKNVNLAEDVVEQIEEKFGEIERKPDFYHEGKEEDLVKSSEKEKHEHPWMTNKQAMRVAKDHARLGEVFIFRKRR